MARVANAEDLPTVAETMARAFHDDPVWGWAFPDPERRLEQQRAFWRFLIGSVLEDYEWTWVTDGCAAVSHWILPNRPELPPRDEERIAPLLEELVGDGAARLLDTFERFEAAHPQVGPHYYLSLLATHPDHRGQGLGMGLLAENLSRIDAQGAAAYLESSNPANDHRYERLGFAPCGKFELGEDGPSVTQMWREPR